jgi:hypothetical protein
MNSDRSKSPAGTIDEAINPERCIALAAVAKCSNGERQSLRRIITDG